MEIKTYLKCGKPVKMYSGKIISQTNPFTLQMILTASSPINSFRPLFLTKKKLLTQDTSKNFFGDLISRRHFSFK